jgi:hypothetical protein
MLEDHLKSVINRLRSGYSYISQDNLHDMKFSEEEFIAICKWLESLVDFSNNRYDFGEYFCDWYIPFVSGRVQFILNIRMADDNYYEVMTPEWFERTKDPHFMESEYIKLTIETPDHTLSDDELKQKRDAWWEGFDNGYTTGCVETAWSDGCGTNELMKMQVTRDENPYVILLEKAKLDRKQDGLDDAPPFDEEAVLKIIKELNDGV